MRMKSFEFVGTAAGLLVTLMTARAAASPPAHQVCETYEITVAKESAQQSSNGSSSSSNDGDAIVFSDQVGLKSPPTQSSSSRQFPTFSVAYNGYSFDTLTTLIHVITAIAAPGAATIYDIRSQPYPYNAH
jgi:hypothetical protein